MTELSPFIGRTDALVELHERVTRHRFVTLVGTAGVGKSRLAQELVGVSAPSFPFGSHIARLAALTEVHDLPASIAGQLGFDSVDAMTLAVGSGRQLLVLDRCDRVAAGALALVDELLDECGELHVVATSRAPLGASGERVFVVEPLAVPNRDDPEAVLAAPAVRLFLDRAEAAASPVEATEENLAAVAGLCRRLDGLPLAIELAASRVRLMTPAEIASHLDRRFELLRRPGEPGPDRHDNLRAALDTSYELLEDAERRAFRTLGITHGAFTAPTAHRLVVGDGTAWSLDEFETLDLLGRLVDRSLVVAEQHGPVTYYRLLATLRHYAEERLVAAGELDEALDRFIDAMVQLADDVVARALERWSTALLRHILLSFTCLRTAIDRAIEIDADGTRAFRLVLPLYGAIHGSRPVEVARIGGRVLERWPDGDEPLRAEATAIIAMAHLLSGETPTARDLAARALAAAEPTVLTAVLVGRTRGFAAWYAGDHETALVELRAAREAAGRLAPTFARELAVAEASVVAGTGDTEAALATLIGVADEAAEAEEWVNAMWATVASASVLMGVGDLDAARTAIASGEAISARLDEVWGRGAVDRLQATLVSLEGGFDDARPMWRRLVDDLGRHGDVEGLALAVRTAAASAYRSGYVDLARELAAATPGRVGRSIAPSPFAAEMAALADHTAGRTGRIALGEVRRLLAAPQAEVTHEASALVPESPALTGDTGATVGADGTPGSSEVPTLVHSGDGWDITYGGVSARLRDLKGLATLAELVARPDVEVHVLDLMGGSDVGDAGPVIDETARLAYQGRIVELQAAVEEASAANDIERASLAEMELDSVVAELSRAYGVGGRERRSVPTVERARAAVRWRLRSAIERISEVHPSAGRHLATAVRTGTWCAYRPEVPVAWHVAAVTADR